MSQTIRRKGTTARSTATRQGQARKVRSARAKTSSALDSVMDWLPLSEGQMHGLFVASFLLGALALAWGVASYAGLPELAGKQLAIAAGDAGFKVNRVEVRGVKNLNELKVYERALIEDKQAMPLVDIEGLRAQLLELSWVKDARVSRQLPDTLVIDIVERTPHAVLRKADKLVLIDGEGAELEPVSAQRARGRLIVSGPGAGRQVTSLTALLEAAPALRPQVREAEWIGNRRWNLTFRSGQVLALPQGEKPASGALMSFARLDGTNRLLGGKVAVFDMRASDRIYLRVPGRAEEQSLATGVAKPKENQ